MLVCLNDNKHAFYRMIVVSQVFVEGGVLKKPMFWLCMVRLNIERVSIIKYFVQGGGYIKDGLCVWYMLVEH